jgi:hypothetical protein
VPDPLAGLFSPEWRAYDAVARALPDCEHNQAWRQLGRDRPVPPDCEHNRVWRAALAAAWAVHLAALSGVPGPGVLCAQEALW